MKWLVRKLYLYRFFSDFMVIYAIFAVLLSDKGLSTFQISILLIVWSLSSLVFEVPSGGWADMYSRKKVLALAEIIRSCGWLIWLIFPNFFGFLIGFIFWGLKNAMVSGTFQALTYDELKSHNQQDRYVKIVGSAEGISLIAIVLGTLSASFVVRISFNAVIITSIIMGVITAAIALSLPSAKVQKNVNQKYLPLLKSGVKEAFRDKKLLSLLSLAAVVGILFGALGNYTTLFIKDTGWSNPSIPVLYALITILLALSSYSAHHFQKFRLSVTFALFGVAGIFLFISTLNSAKQSVALLAAYLLIMKLLVVIYDGKVQHHLKSDMRATITSVKGFIEQLGSIVVYLSFGFLASHTNRFVAFRYFGMTIILCSLLGLWLWIYRYRPTEIA